MADGRCSDPSSSEPIPAKMSFARAQLLLIAIVIALLALPAQSGAARLKNCGGGVRAAIVSCPKAKRIAEEYAKTKAHSLQGYRCSAGRGQARCTLDRKLVVFRV
jgi:hypothetical protein